MTQDEQSTSNALTGSCLCGGVTFEVDGPIVGIGQCHCSLCRKVSGTASNAVFIVGNRRFRWTQGESSKRRYVLRNDWGPTRCTTCGSPLPESHDGKRYWVPAGLMDAPLNTTVQMHIHVASKADWETIHDDAPRHASGPGDS
jgi:hypothetical protein